MKVFLTLWLCLSLVACGTYQQAKETKEEAPQAKKEAAGEKKVEKKAPSSGDVVAYLDGKPITNAELEEFVGPALAKIRQQEYDIKYRGLMDLLFLKLQQQEAAKEGITVEDYFKKHVTDQTKEPTEDEITQTLNRYRSRLPKDEKQARQKVVDFLKSQKVRQQEETFKKELLAKANYQVLLEPIRVPIPMNEKDSIIGAKDAPITIVEFSDFQCPYCARAYKTVKELLKEYEGKIKIVFKHFPLQFHKQARPASLAALCAGEQGKFEAMHDWLFEHRTKLNEDGFKQAAEELGLDMEKFNACFSQKTYDDFINKTMEEAQKMGVSATPTFFINGRMLQGAQPIQAFKEIIDQELSLQKKAGS